MYLAGQDNRAVEPDKPSNERATGGQSGYAMVALLVSLSIMSMMLTVAMPVWKQMAQREKEAELVFRGQQYARAIGLFQRRAGPGTLPPNFDILVEQRFLRKKYKDPITGEDFLPVLQGQANQPPGGRGGQPPGPAGNPPGPTPGQAAPGQAGQTGRTAQAGQGGAAGGIMGVVSKSDKKSIRIFNGRNVYNQWAFTFVPPPQAAGEGGRGGRGGAPGTPGGPLGPGGVPGPGGTGSPFGPGPGGPLGPGPGAPGRGRPDVPGGGVPQPPGGSPFQTSPFQPQPPRTGPGGPAQPPGQRPPGN